MISDRSFLCSVCGKCDNRRADSLRAPKCCGERMNKIRKANVDIGLRRKVIIDDLGYMRRFWR